MHLHDSRVIYSFIEVHSSAYSSIVAGITVAMSHDPYAIFRFSPNSVMTPDSEDGCDFINDPQVPSPSPPSTIPWASDVAPSVAGTTEHSVDDTFLSSSTIDELPTFTTESNTSLGMEIFKQFAI